jgi:hypothetical protein
MRAREREAEGENSPYRLGAYAPIHLPRKRGRIAFGFAEQSATVLMRGAFTPQGKSWPPIRSFD